MANYFTASFEPSSTRHLIGVFMNHAQSAGWSVVKWSNGTTITTGGAPTFTSSSLSGSGSWVIIQQPAGGAAPVSGSRQLLFWNKGGGDGQWIINYSQSGAYGASGQSSTVPPTATDEVTTQSTSTYYARNTGFDVIFNSSYLPSGTPYVVQMGADTSLPLLWMFAYAKGAGNASNTTTKMLFAMDVMEDGSYPFDVNDPTNAGKGDKDPIVFVTRLDQGGSAIANPVNSGRVCYKAFGLAGQTWTDPGVALSRPSSGYHHNTAKADLVPVIYGGSNNVLKGVSKIFKYCSKDLNTLTILDGSSEDRLMVGDCAVPWDTANTLTP